MKIKKMMPKDITFESARKEIAEKDAKIERLQGEIKRLKRIISGIGEREALLLMITELTDALEPKTSCVEDDDIALVKRARDKLEFWSV
jgi:hypothetical protein